MYVYPQRVGFLSSLGVKIGIDFDHCSLKLSMYVLHTCVTELFFVINIV